MAIRYPATVEAQKDGTDLVLFVDLPDTFTQGQTKEEALFSATEVLSAMLAWRLDVKLNGSFVVDDLGAAVLATMPAQTPRRLRLRRNLTHGVLTDADELAGGRGYSPDQACGRAALTPNRASARSTPSSTSSAMLCGR